MPTRTKEVSTVSPRVLEIPITGMPPLLFTMLLDHLPSTRHHHEPTTEELAKEQSWRERFRAERLARKAAAFNRSMKRSP